ncbi:hypothetical protein ACFYQA_37655 [Streptomyces sp. NPDC005774]|uniref:hypothetical protein n=1 Tax=Streptomyces sp. NPDC005774 TaxID=3364728 RepID=UPI003681A0F9
MVLSTLSSSRGLPGGSSLSLVARVVRTRVTARTAAASRLITLQRIQEFQQVTWPWSRPVIDFAFWKVSSIFHLVQITWTRSASAAGTAEWQR